VEAPVRIAARNLLPLGGALFAVHLLLPQVGQAHATVDALRRASWPWLAVTALIGTVTYLMGAVALIGASGRRLPVRRTWLVQVASSFTNRLAPAGLGGMRTNVRYLEASGVTRPAALASIGLVSVAGFVVHLIGIALIVPLLGAGNTHLRLAAPDLTDHWPVLIGVIGVLTLVGLLRWGVLLRGRVGPSARSAWGALTAVLRHPRSAVALFAGSAGVTLGYALSLAAAGRATSIGLPLATVVAVYLGGAAVAAVAPTPGGLGAIEAALVAGLTSAGAAAGPAVAAVLAYRLITYWLPVLPGAVAFQRLRRRGIL
jgi:undecaprenyl-diphosphatase